MKREEVYSVKIYFIKPIDLIQVVINTLIEMEYETYTISENDQEKLLKIMPQDIRNVVFICVTNKQEAPKWLEYIEHLKKIDGTNIQIGAFVYSAMEMDIKQQFLLNQVSVTAFSDIKDHTLDVIKTILQIFEAKGRRKYIRVNARGISEVFISVRNLKNPIKGRVVNLSAFAFTCEIDSAYHNFFKPGQYFSELLLALKGIRIRIAAKMLGFSKNNKNICIFRYYGLEIQNGKMTYSEHIPREIRQKFHKYITSCLREDLNEKLEKVDSG